MTILEIDLVTCLSSRGPVAWGLSEPQVRTLTFTTIVIADLSLILTNRSWSETVLTTPGPGTGRLWWSFCRR